MTRRWALRLVVGVPSVMALGFVAWGGYWASLRSREVGAARTAFSAFVAALNQGRIEEAYRDAAPELRCRMTLAQFRGVADYYARLQPGPHAEVSLKHGWPYVHAADVEVATHYDQDIPHHAAMVKLEGPWRLAWIDSKAADEVRERDRDCGERSVHIEMLRQPLRELVDGLERGDYAALAARFRKQVDGPGLAENYARLKPKLAALREALGAEPVFEGGPESGDRERKLAASLRGQGVRFQVKAHFVSDGEWKLVSFEVEASQEAN